MINVKFFYQKKILIGIESRGHSDYAERGEDIICAAVSVLMQALILGLTEIARLENVELEIDEKVPVIKIKWPKKRSKSISLLTASTAESLKIIAQDNPDYVKIYTEEI